MPNAFETVGHREAVERLLALRVQALRDVDGELLLDARGSPNELEAALARLEQVDKDIRREEVRAMQGWHRAGMSQAAPGEAMPKVLDPGRGGRAAMRAAAIGFIGRTIVMLSQRASPYEFGAQCAIHLQHALDAVGEGRYEDAIAATELAAVAGDDSTLDRTDADAPTRWQLSAALVELATRHVRHA